MTGNAENEKGADELQSVFGRLAAIGALRKDVDLSKEKAISMGSHVGERTAQMVLKLRVANLLDVQRTRNTVSRRLLLVGLVVGPDGGVEQSFDVDSQHVLIGENDSGTSCGETYSDGEGSPQKVIEILQRMLKATEVQIAETAKKEQEQAEAAKNIDAALYALAKEMEGFVSKHADLVDNVADLDCVVEEDSTDRAECRTIRVRHTPSGRRFEALFSASGNLICAKELEPKA